MDTLELRKIARLSKLKLSDEEVAHYAEKLTEVLNYVSQINAVQTDDIEPMRQAVPINLVLREDKITEKNQKDLFLSGAPDAQENLFTVPPVME